MPDIDVALLDHVLDWEARLPEEARAQDARVVAALAEDACTAALPLMFHAPRRRAALELSLTAGLDLTRRRANGDTVLFEPDLHDPDADRCLADAFAAKGSIDCVKENGMTALSAHVRSGSAGSIRRASCWTMAPIRMP